MVYFQSGSPTASLSQDDLKEGLYTALALLGKKNKILVIPLGFTGFPSCSGKLAHYIWDFYGDKLTDILPATGNNIPMTPHQIDEMFGDVPKGLFRVHDWRNDVVALGEVPAEYVREVSGNSVDFAWPAQVNKLLVEGGFDLILSIGQVGPFEIAGMANNHNIFVGTAGAEGASKGLFIDAALGAEKINHHKTPARRIFDFANHAFMEHLPVVQILTVVGMEKADGALKVHGLYIGDDSEVLKAATALSLKVNFIKSGHPMKKVVVYLDPDRYKSTWQCNKSVYRTKMDIADGGELVVLAPALKEFGENAEIDRLIRKYGYFGTSQTLQSVRKNDDLRNNLDVATHLILGSSEGRFSITYCPRNERENLTRQEIENVGFKYADAEDMARLYDPSQLKDGWNKSSDGEEFFYISDLDN